MKRIKIVMERQGVSAVAELYEDLAPKTCRAVLSALPLETNMRHAQFIGHFCWLNLCASEKPTEELKKLAEEFKKSISPENHTKYPLPGELLFGMGIPAWEGGERGASTTIFDFLMCYGPDSHTRADFSAISVFGVIIENLKDIVTACQKLTRLGEEPVRIEVLEGDFPLSEERLIPVRWGHYALGGAHIKD